MYPMDAQLQPPSQPRSATLIPQYYADEEDLGRLSQVLTGDEAAQALSLALSKALDDADPFLKAATLIAAHLGALGVDGSSPAKRRIRQRLVSAAALLATSGRSSRQGVAVTDDEKAVFLVGIASGMSTAQAAGLVPSVNPHTWYALKRSDLDFAERWDDAMDLTADTTVARMAEIAQFGDETLPTTISAAKLVVQSQSRRNRTDLQAREQAGKAGRMKVSLSIEVTTPIADG